MPDLSIQIKATADSAIRSIDVLEKKLDSLNVALGSLGSASQLSNLAMGVRELGGAMSQLKATQSARSFSILSDNLNKIASVNFGAIEGVANSLMSFVPALQSLSGNNINVNVTKLVNALAKLSSTNLGALQSADFGRVGAGLSQLTNALANSSKVSARTTNLVSALARLSATGSSIGVVTQSLPALAVALRNFFGVMSTSSVVSGETIQLTMAISQLANAGAKASLTAQNLGALGVQLNKLIGTLANAPQVTQNTLQLVQALSQISNQGVRINATTGGMRTGLANLIPTMKRTRKSTLSLAAAFGKFYATWFLLIRGVKGLWSTIKSAMDFVEVYNYFDASISQVAQKASQDWEEAGYSSAEAYYDALYEGFTAQAKELNRKMTGYTVDASGNLTQLGSTNLGLNPQTLLNYQAQFAQLSSSMGVASEYAMKMSTALSEIGADLASVKNMEFKEVWDNLSSGIVGMSRAVDKYGVNIRNTALQQKLYDLGIDVSITKLGQQDKALLRTITILDSTRYAWADLSDTLEQPANQLRMLKASFESLGRTIGSAFLSAIAQLLPYINAVVIALQRLVQYLIDFFGITLVSISSSAGADMSDLLDSIYDMDDALSDASGSAKKLKQNLLGIDELNVIQSDTDSGAGGGGLADYSSQLQDAFDKIFEEYQKVWDKAYDDVENKAQGIADRIVNAFKKGDFFAIGETISTGLRNTLDNIPWESIFEGARKFGSNIANFLNELINPETFGSIGRTIANGLNTVFYFVGDFIDRFDPVNAGWSLAELFNNFVETLDAKQLGHDISEGLKKALRFVAEFLRRTDFYELGQKFGEFLKELDWKGILEATVDVIISAIAGLLNAFSGSFNVDPFATLLVGAIALAIGAGTVLPIVNALTLALASNPIVLTAGALIIAYEAMKNEENIGKDSPTGVWGNRPKSDRVYSNQGRNDNVSSNGFWANLSQTYGWLTGQGQGGGAGRSHKYIETTAEDYENLFDKIQSGSVWLALVEKSFNSLIDTIGQTNFNKVNTSTQQADSSMQDFSNTLDGVNFNTVSDSAQDYDYITQALTTDTGKMTSATNLGYNAMVSLSGAQLNNTRLLQGYATQLNTTSSNMGALKDATATTTQTMTNDFTKATDSFNKTIMRTFGAENLNTALASVPQVFKKVFTQSANIVLGIFNTMIDAINHAMTVTWSDFEIGGEKVLTGGSAQLFSINRIPMFAMGGFPEDGLFFANSSEMVGRFTNGKTAVANNEQIVAGIEQGVYNAMISAMNSGANNVNVVLEGDAEGIFRVVQKQNRIYKKSTGASAFA